MAPALRGLYKAHGNYLRFRSVEKVIEELLQIKARYKPTSLVFYDEIFFRDKEYSSKFLQAYKTKIGIPYICLTRADLVNEEIVRTLKDTGCFYVCFGIEHGNEVLRNKLLGKNLTDKAILACAALLRKYKIPFATLNIVGFPGEKISHVWDAIRINTLARPTWSKFFVYQTLPATKLAEYSLENGFVETVDIASSDATMLMSGAVVRKSGECERILRLKCLANIFIKLPFLQKIAKSALLNIPVDSFFNVLEKILGLYYYYYPQLSGHRFSEKLSTAWFFIKHREEFE